MEQANITVDNKLFISLKLQISFEYSGTETKKYTYNYICAIVLYYWSCAVVHILNSEPNEKFILIYFSHKYLRRFWKFRLLKCLVWYLYSLLSIWIYGNNKHLL
jgi:hypothetical protein